MTNPGPRPVRAAHGARLTARSWQTEAALRERVPGPGPDRHLAPEIEAAEALIREGNLP